MGPRTAHSLPAGRPGTARTAISRSTGYQRMSASCCLRAPFAARTQLMSAPCGALPQIIDMIPRKARSGSIPIIITAS